MKSTYQYPSLELGRHLTLYTDEVKQILSWGVYKHYRHKGHKLIWNMHIKLVNNAKFVEG